MNPIYEKLFDTYANSILKEAEIYQEDEISNLLKPLSLDKSTEIEILDLFSNYYFRWATDAFTVGLHLGLSLPHDNIRRGRPQQVQ